MSGNLRKHIARDFSLGYFHPENGTWCSIRLGDVRLSSGSEIDLLCLDIVAISVSKELLWHSVEIQSRSQTDCLREEPGVLLAADHYSFINSHFLDLIGAETDRLSEVEQRCYP